VTVFALFDDKGPDAVAAAARVFKNRHLLEMDGNMRRLMVSQATSAGLPDGVRFYLRLLETPGNTIGEKTYDRPVAEVAADEVLDQFASQDRTVDAIKKKPTPPEEKVAALKTWLQAKIEKLEGAK
jgi:hypothetical protein